MIKLFGRENSVDKIQEEAQEFSLALHQMKCVTKTDWQKQLAGCLHELADVKIGDATGWVGYSAKRRLIN
jgi:hypothetical protein